MGGIEPNLPKTKVSLYRPIYPTIYFSGKGLGGSEEAVVYLTQELAAMGYRVEVYGDPPVEDITVGDPHDHHCHCQGQDRSNDHDHHHYCHSQDQGKGNGNGNSNCQGHGSGQGQVFWFHHSQVQYTPVYSNHLLPSTSSYLLHRLTSSYLVMYHVSHTISSTWTTPMMCLYPGEPLPSTYLNKPHLPISTTVYLPYPIVRCGPPL